MDDKIVQDLNDANHAINLTVKSLQMIGIDTLSISTELFQAAGKLLREAFPDEASRRRVILHAAEVAITGRPQPFLEQDDG